MKKNKKITTAYPSFSGTRSALFCVTAALAMAAVPVVADQSTTFIQTNLVSNQAGVAQLQDTNLVNAWGIASSYPGPFFVSDNGSGMVSLYQVTGGPGGSQQVANGGLTISIPGDGTPSGMVYNGTEAFNGDIFIFSSEDGTISGWQPILAWNAETLTMRTNAVYKGITLATNVDGGPLLVLANFGEGTVDVYDSNMNLVQLTDPNAPAGYAPFNVMAMGNLVLVTFAKQDSAKHDDVAGAGNGLIEILDLKTGKFRKFAAGSSVGGHVRDMNSPWGMTIAPIQGAGPHLQEQLLVGNFGSGTIMMFNAQGSFQGLLEQTNHHPIVIDGLWGLTTGGGGMAGITNAIYFTAGPDGESNGLFGSLVPVAAKSGRGGH